MALIDCKKAYNNGAALMDPEMPGDGWGCQEYNLHNQLQHAELDIRHQDQGTVLGQVDVKRGIFQGDSLSPLLFMVIMLPLTLVREGRELVTD